MPKNEFRTRAGQTVTVRGARWDCHGCNQNGKAKRNEVEMVASGHANSCREEDRTSYEAECRRKTILRRSNLTDSRLQSIAAEVGGELQTQGNTAHIKVRGKHPANGWWLETYRYRRNPNGTWNWG